MVRGLGVWGLLWEFRGLVGLGVLVLGFSVGFRAQPMAFWGLEAYK